MMTEPLYIAFYSEEDCINSWNAGLKAIRPEIQLVAVDSRQAEAADVLITWNPPDGLIASMDNLKGVISLAQGVDHILAHKAFPSRLKLARLIDPYMADSMAEWVVLAVLAQHRRQAEYRQFQAEQNWQVLPLRMAENTTVAVMGLGAIGGVVAQKIAMMGFKTMGWSRRPKSITGVECLAGTEGFWACLRGADYCASILPLTDETRDIYDADAFQAMKNDAVFINSGRGAQVVEADLLTALDTGAIAAAVLDVTRTEPLPQGNPLWTHPKVTIWPHVSAQTNPNSAASQIIDAISAIRQGHQHKNFVDIDRGY